MNQIHMFISKQFDSVSDTTKEELTGLAVSALKPELYRDGRWYADYVRLRMKAIKQTNYGFVRMEHEMELPRNNNK